MIKQIVCEPMCLFCCSENGELNLVGLIGRHKFKQKFMKFPEHLMLLAIQHMRKRSFDSCTLESRWSRWSDNPLKMSLVPNALLFDESHHIFFLPVYLKFFNGKNCFSRIFYVCLCVDLFLFLQHIYIFIFILYIIDIYIYMIYIHIVWDLPTLFCNGQIYSCWCKEPNLNLNNFHLWTSL